MTYYIIMDGIKIKLYKGRCVMNIDGHLYTPYCYLIKSDNGMPVLFINDTNIIIDSQYQNNIYKNNINVIPDEIIDIHINDQMPDGTYQVI